MLSGKLTTSSKVLRLSDSCLKILWLFKNVLLLPWLVWLSGSRADLQTRWSLGRTILVASVSAGTQSQVFWIIMLSSLKVCFSLVYVTLCPPVSPPAFNSLDNSPLLSHPGILCLKKLMFPSVYHPHLYGYDLAYSYVGHSQQCFHLKVLRFFPIKWATK